MSTPTASSTVPDRPTQTQADRLPEFKQIVIPGIKKLSAANDIYFWGSCIHVSLGGRRLTDLISRTIPRPDPDHPRYKTWTKWSRLVSKWLVQNVDEKFTTHFKNIQPELEFADSTFRAIEGLNIPKTAKEHYMSKALVRLWNTRRHNFTGVDDYVDAWRDQVLACQGLTVGFNYLSATLIMLHEIEAELPVLVKFIHVQVESKDHTSPGQLTYNQFNDIVHGIIRAVQKESWKPPI